MVGFTENGIEVPGLLEPGGNTDYIKDLVNRYPPTTDDFPGNLFSNMQNRIDGLCQNLPIVLYTLERVIPESSSSTFMAEFPGTLDIDEFKATVSDIVQIVDILKIKNEVTGVWTDFGSSVFGFDIDGPTALTLLNAAIFGAQQFLDLVRSVTPETLKMYFRILSLLREKVEGQPLDEQIISNDTMVNEAIRTLGGEQVTVNLTSDVTSEQKNGLGQAIPRVADIVSRDWNLSCSAPIIEGSQVYQSTIIIAAGPVVVALPPSPEATNEVNDCS